MYSSDKLPASVSHYPALFIANVDASHKPGSHWVAFYFTKEQEGEFFDILRITSRQIFGNIYSFLNNNSNQWIFNTVTLQSFYSKVCGHYCLYFALYHSRQISMSTIAHHFSKNTRKNDNLVKRFIEKHFPIRLLKYRTDKNKQRAQAQQNIQ